VFRDVGDDDDRSSKRRLVEPLPKVRACNVLMLSESLGRRARDGEDVEGKVSGLGARPVGVSSLSGTVMPVSEGGGWKAG
jgi:hypothetical protein